MASRTERRWPPVQPFDGQPPPVKPGDQVEIRDAHGKWWPAVAVSKPRYDFDRGIPPRTHLTVAVDGRPPFRWAGPVNWPAEHVRPASGEEPSDA
jgi:hypothetical protein